MTRVLVIGHADADGHLIAEQARRNLDLISGFDVEVVVDPSRTKDHKAWMHLDQINEINDAEIIFFVDLMFSPASYAAEADALVMFAKSKPDKHFYLIDHHPLPLRRLNAASNLRVVYRPEVFDCTLGPRSGMMVIAAMCENQIANVADIKEPIHDVFALGMRRAAALGGALPGEKLLALLKADRWDVLLRLGDDAKEHHFLPRGRRPANQIPSSTLKEVEDVAEKLMSGSVKVAMPKSVGGDSGSFSMPYDLGAVTYVYDDDRRHKNDSVSARDLEAITTLLEVAALTLTDRPDVTFTLEQLIHQAREIGGEEMDLNERDVKIVLEKQNFVEKAGPGLRLR